jgi:hypothetical protein
VLITCNLSRGFTNIEALFPGKSDKSILTEDWSPVAYTRTGGGPGRDSVAKAIWKAGVRTVVMQPLWINTNPNISASASPLAVYSGATAPAADPWGYGPDAESIPIYNDPSSPGSTPRSVIGKLSIVAERGNRSGPNIGYTDPSHDIKSEWFDGLFQNRWYFAPIPYYLHSFWTRTPVITVAIGHLGGHGVAPGAIGTGPARIGWWTIKHIANEVNVANSLGWVQNGKQRKVFEFVYISEIEP